MRIPATDRTKMFKTAIKNGLKLMTLDSETSHAIARTFYIGRDVSLQHRQVKVPNKVITIQYKWAHEPKAKFLEWTKVSNRFDDARNFDDSKMITEFLTNILPQADIVLTQNGDAFDLKVLNERAKELHLPIMVQKPSMDILKLSRKSFKSLSHKLDYRSSQQGLGGKITMVDDDWVDVEEKGVPVSRKMAPYGLKDVMDTESLMWKELPYYKDLPVAIEKVIQSFIPKTFPTSEKRLKCLHCEEMKESKFEVTKKGSHIFCNRCGSHYRIEGK